jgi:hypothetical protein
MIVCQYELPEWVQLTPSERDAIRLGFNTFEVPVGARKWFETEWAWLMQKQRYEQARARERRFTGRRVPVSVDEMIFLEAFKRWSTPQKKDERRAKIMLRIAVEWLKDLFSGITHPITSR